MLWEMKSALLMELSWESQLPGSSDGSERVRGAWSSGQSRAGLGVCTVFPAVQEGFFMGSAERLEYELLGSISSSAPNPLGSLGQGIFFLCASVSPCKMETIIFTLRSLRSSEDSLSLVYKVF